MDKPSPGRSGGMAHPPPSPRPSRRAWLADLLSGPLSEAAGILLLALAFITVLSLVGLTGGAWLDPWVALWRRWLGWGSILVVAGLAVLGWRLLRGEQSPALAWSRMLSLELAAFAFLGLLSLLAGHSLERAESGLDGGLIGWGLSESLVLLLDLILPRWAAQLLSGLLFLALTFFTGSLALSQLGALGSRLGYRGRARQVSDEPALSISPMGAAGSEEGEAVASAPSKRRPASSRLPRRFRKELPPAPATAAPAKALPRSADLPPLDLLAEEKATKQDQRHINQSAGIIEKTLSEFGITARVVGYQVGPTVTQYAVEPGYLQKGDDEDEENRQRVRVSQISALQRDLALALSAQRLRIQAPVPGRPYVGIEVPNTQTSLVRLRPLLESEVFHKLSSPLAIALGRDVSGAPVVADLTQMPHLLIAGTTGSGKSVLISSITTCLAMNNSPADLRLIMLDPKMVELVRFNGLPHLLGNVETKLDRITAVLRWVVAEMGRRYKLLEEVRARDIDSYNRKKSSRKGGETLPRLVILIDELADLMMSAAEHTESILVRLAQMARATGIHLVVATQRPSTDVVTGLIKANFPARISFAVASAVDSRVVLDTSGAESLLGRGDMLYLAPEAAAPLRSQGVMISDREIEAVVKYWQANWPLSPEEQERAPWDAMIQQAAVLSDRDDLIESAIAEIRRSGKSSASHLQRALRIGYPRAARLVDELEDMGILGPVQSGGREREVLVDLDEHPDFDDAA